MVYYSVHKVINAGIFKTWEECKSETEGFSGDIFKKFNNYDEALYFKTNSKLKELLISKYIEKNINKSAADIIVYTDGACSNNGLKNAKAGIGIYFSENDSRNVSRSK